MKLIFQVIGAALILNGGISLLAYSFYHPNDTVNIPTVTAAVYQK